MTARSEALPIATGAQVRAEVGVVMRGRRRVLALAVVVLVLSAAAGLIAPAALGGMVDAVGAADATGQVIRLGVVMVAGALVEGLLLGLGVVLASRLAERLLAAVRERMVACALQLPQAVVERAGSGDLISRATDDVAMISEVAPRAVPAIGGAAFTIVTTVAGMAVLDWRFAIAMLLILPVHVLTVRWYLRTAPQVIAPSVRLTQTRQPACCRRSAVSRRCGRSSCRTASAQRSVPRRGGWRSGRYVPGSCKTASSAGSTSPSSSGSPRSW